MQDNSTHVVELAHEDRQRMARLYEEVNGRLAEMGMIVSRTLGLSEPENRTLSFQPMTQDAAIARNRFQGTKIVCTPVGCGCYDYDGGECWAC